MHEGSSASYNIIFISLSFVYWSRDFVPFPEFGWYEWIQIGVSLNCGTAYFFFHFMTPIYRLRLFYCCNPTNYPISSFSANGRVKLLIHNASVTFSFLCYPYTLLMCVCTSTKPTPQRTLSRGWCDELFLYCNILTSLVISRIVNNFVVLRAMAIFVCTIKHWASEWALCVRAGSRTPRRLHYSKTLIRRWLCCTASVNGIADKTSN